MLELIVEGIAVFLIGTILIGIGGAALWSVYMDNLDDDDDLQTKMYFKSTGTYYNFSRICTCCNLI